MAIHEYLLHNGRIAEAARPELFAGQLGLLAGWGVFTTLRVASGVLFAWERHWARISRDARLLNVQMPARADEIERDLLRLVEANGRPDCTLRLVVVRNRGGMWEGPSSGESASDTIALTADSKNWNSTVRLGIQPNARFAANEFAGAKVLSWAQNLTWAERAQQQGMDETILLNERSHVAECTSANIFAAWGNEVYTPPAADGCLRGITREILLEGIDYEARDTRGVCVTERSLTVGDLYEADEVFITSTTRGLLPVEEIAGRELKRKSVATDLLSAAFERFFEQDIARRKPAAVAN